jgi:hypothetical protein
MPNPAAAESAIQLMREAAEANHADACRVGSLIEFPGEGDVFVAGDLHGNRFNYQKVVETAALSRNQKRHLILQEIIHGLKQTMDGRDLSYQILEMAARLKTYFPDQVHFLLGNHDVGELRMADIQKAGLSSLKGLDKALAVAYGEQKDHVRAAYHEFIASFAVAAQTRTGVFIGHSIPERKHLHLIEDGVFRRPLSREDLTRDSYVYRLVWGREFSQEASDAFAERVGARFLITGHMPVEPGYAFVNTRHLILDSKDDKGCYILLPLDRELTYNQLAQLVRRIRSDRPVL